MVMFLVVAEASSRASWSSNPSPIAVAPAMASEPPDVDAPGPSPSSAALARAAGAPVRAHGATKRTQRRSGRWRRGAANAPRMRARAAHDVAATDMGDAVRVRVMLCARCDARARDVARVRVRIVLNWAPFVAVVGEPPRRPR